MRTNNGSEGGRDVWGGQSPRMHTVGTGVEVKLRSSGSGGQDLPAKAESFTVLL